MHQRACLVLGSIYVIYIKQRFTALYYTALTARIIPNNKNLYNYTTC
jgi:hypothetical protein